MLRRPAVLLLISAGMHLTAHAQETAIRSSDGDSLRYSYTPLPPQAPEKRPFLRRVVDYFGESTTDKTFEKKIDFTFAGGPSYLKNTSFGIGRWRGTLPASTARTRSRRRRTSRSSATSRCRASMRWA